MFLSIISMIFSFQGISSRFLGCHENTLKISVNKRSQKDFCIVQCMSLSICALCNKFFLSVSLPKNVVSPPPWHITITVTERDFVPEKNTQDLRNCKKCAKNAAGQWMLAPAMQILKQAVFSQFFFCGPGQVTLFTKSKRDSGTREKFLKVNTL